MDVEAGAHVPGIIRVVAGADKDIEVGVDLVFSGHRSGEGSFLIWRGFGVGEDLGEDTPFIVDAALHGEVVDELVFEVLAGDIGDEIIAGIGIQDPVLPMCFPKIR